MKKAEWEEKIDSFEIWHQRVHQGAPGTSKKAHKWLLRQVKPEISLEAKMKNMRIFILAKRT